MAVVLVQLGKASLQEWRDWLLLAISAWLLFRLKVPGPLLILIAALAGWGLRSGGLLLG